MESLSMAYTLTKPQKRLMRDLLQVGRWNNESEIIRYGLHLVAKEVQADQSQNLEPLSKDVLMRAYRKLSKADLDEEKAMERASARPQQSDLE
jgi:Arc/MetJ-type ribon-helix-helix transcriptional regulator